MLKILVLFAHPTLEQSVVNKKLIRRMRSLPNISVRDLYELYPDFDIPVRVEQAALERHDIVIWMHPIYWYSAPPLIKQWIDLVLLHDWAYGTKGTALKDKWIFNAVTTGATLEAYQEGGHHGYPLKDFLLPYKQTAALCHMHYLPPYVIDGTFSKQPKEIEQDIEQFISHLQLLQSGTFEVTALKQFSYLNQLKDQA
ncbi:NAD(P)H-dependent oxidoreductase [Sphingobacterium spiritivorum]|uniref:glutathione-regulated potassium-efflux system oxidoreductase KefF n=1 Tax=Sphingobacterium spiritivorum TaxID=258 RepID=UPI003DA56A24